MTACCHYSTIHLPQSLINPSIFFNLPSNMSNTFERKWPNFDKQNILFIYFLIEWNERFKIDEKIAIILLKSSWQKCLHYLTLMHLLRKNKFRCGDIPEITPEFPTLVPVTTNFPTSLLQQMRALGKKSSITNMDLLENYYQILQKTIKKRSITSTFKTIYVTWKTFMKVLKVW